jgi:ATP-dependent helicase YprA (DUF1998 family)
MCSHRYLLVRCTHIQVQKQGTNMAKPTSKQSVSAVTQSAGLAARALARLDAAAKAALAAAQADAESEQSLQLVAAVGHVSALIKTPGMTLQIENGQFAVTINQNQK